MTHSGGQPHVTGDHGQRYEITVLDEDEGRIVVGWTDDPNHAQRVAKSILTRAGWSDSKINDRQPETSE